ncbi:hypothetical protein FP568_03285 [Pandoraea pnomenusa]|uniref:type VI secretion system domain-containing protein n=1 Tax=Pandoraea pnomenusa TaxID=93220 RepID=UPI0011989CBE|nr:type VI secretion system domain-containing protein [Pandoraea pnomenusa]QDX20376.1 hypothetical protein FP568_03285 [Pandoraea pnomenusa]
MLVTKTVAPTPSNYLKQWDIRHRLADEGVVRLAADRSNRATAALSQYVARTHDLVASLISRTITSNNWRHSVHGIFFAPLTPASTVSDQTTFGIVHAKLWQTIAQHSRKVRGRRIGFSLAACGTIARADLERTMAALDVLLAHASRWPETSRPNLQALVSHFERTVSAADATADNTLAAANATPATKALPVAASIEPVKTAHDVLAQARVMARWLRSQEHGYLSAARLVRSVRWDTLQDLPPADVTGKTRLTAPRAELRNALPARGGQGVRTRPPRPRANAQHGPCRCTRSCRRALI